MSQFKIIQAIPGSRHVRTYNLRMTYAAAHALSQDRMTVVLKISRGKMERISQ